MLKDKADRYANIKYTLAIAELVYTLLLLLALQISGFNFVLKLAVCAISASALLQVALYSAVIFILYSLLTFGLDAYRSFVVEHYFELSKQKFASWILDYLKSAALGLFMFVFLMECFYFFVRNFTPGWWWMSALFWIFVIVVVAKIFPVVVIPLFFKYKRISDEGLRKSIFELAAKMRVKLLDVFEIDFSKKSLKANAAFVGMGKSRRVLLTDTLLNGGFQPKEIELILAHEFAHYRLRHLLKMVLLNAAEIFIIFYIFSRLDGAVLKARDLADLGGWLFLFMLFQLVSAPFVNILHRTMERNADGAAIKAVGDREAFISMMTKLADKNLAQRKPPLWAKIFFYDHPPVDERIALAEKITLRQCKLHNYTDAV